MKNLILYTTLLIVTSVFSQTTLETIYKSQEAFKGEIKVDVSNKNRQKYFIGESKLKKTNRSKIIDLYLKKDKKIDICLIPLYSINEFDVYVCLPNSIIKKILSDSKKYGVNMSKPNIIDFFLIFDRNKSSLIQHNSDVAGSIAFSDQNSIIINFEFDNLKSEVIKLDENFKPTSSFFNSFDKVTNKTSSFISNYYVNNGAYRIKSKLIDTKEGSDSISKKPIFEIESYLNTKLVDFDQDDLTCDSLKCDSKISHWIYPVMNYPPR